MSDNQAPQVPQFSTAEYATTAAVNVCQVCKHPVSATYYRANNAVVCGGCADNLKRQLPQDNHAAFVRAILFGIGGFAVGMAIYAGFSIVTGIQIGYLSLAVGWIIGKAMMMGSGNVGGRRYQIAAVVLTYAAVSMAAIPIALSYQSKIKPTQTTKQTSSRTDNSATPTQDGQIGEDRTNQTGEAPAHPSAMSRLLIALAKMGMIGLASPFLELAEGGGGVIGLIILFVGMRFAWKMTAGTARMSLQGPFQTPTASAASA
jgi:hypothetical protein